MKNYIRIIRPFLLAGCLFVCSCQSMSFSQKNFENPFFAMDTGTDARNKTIAQQAEMLCELGYDGYGYTDFENLPEVLSELDKNNLKLFTIYTELKPYDKQPFNPKLKESLKMLDGKDTFIWFFIKSSQFKKSSPEGDGKAVTIIREIADIAKKYDVKIALYPHTFFWMERTEDALRVARKVNRKNVGITFNLCHWLKVEGDKDPKAVLKSAMPHLFVVTINGADKGAAGWDRLIQPLDKGSFDNYELLKNLKDLGYRGPIGLQGYGIKGNAHENLKRSITAWKKLHRSRQNSPKIIVPEK